MAFINLQGLGCCQPPLTPALGFIRLVGLLFPLLSLNPSISLGSSLLVNFESSEIRAGGSPLGAGASLFVVSPVSSESDFYSSLGAINSAAALAGFFSNTNQLRYFNLADPVNYGSDNGGDVDSGTFRGWPEGGTLGWKHPATPLPVGFFFLSPPAPTMSSMPPPSFFFCVARSPPTPLTPGYRSIL